MDNTQYGLNPEVAGDTALTFDNQPEASRKEGKRVVARWGGLDSEAINWKLHWQHSYEYTVPRKEDVVAQRMPGDERETDVYDTTAIRANEQLAAALHSMLTNPELNFFEILFGVPELDEDSSVKEWCQKVGNRMFQILNSSNFQTEIFEVYIDLGAAGTAILYMGEDDEFTIMFSARALKECRIDEDFRGMVNTVYRCYKLTPTEIIDQFEKDKLIPREIYELAEKDSTDKLEIIHAVEPITAVRDRESQQIARTKKHKFSSKYVLKDKSYLLSDKSFAEFPYASPRWSKTSGEKYGRGPGFQMLGDIRMVNAMKLTVIQGGQKTVDPPLMVEDDGVIGQVRLTPGGLTIVRPGSEPIKPLITDARVDYGEKMLESIQSDIRSGFYIDQLTLPKESPQRTAEEVRQIAEEQMRLMGPILGRQHFELLRPLVTRLFGIMERRGEIPEAPAIIKGKVFDVKYSSLMARAQQLQALQGINRALGIMAPIAENNPQIMDLVKMDDVGRYVWDVCGNPAKLLLNQRELDAKRKVQQQQKDKVSQQQDALHQSMVAKNAAPLVGQLAQNQPQGSAPVAPAQPGA